MRPYPVQRHKCPSRALAIAARSPLLPRPISDAARTTIPGIQNPHCTPPSSTNASPMIRRVSSGRPSSVTMSCPSICSGFRRHDSAGRPSILTRQQPQAPSGAHPSLALTMPHDSRNTSSKRIPGSYEASVAIPLSVKFTVGMLRFEPANSIPQGRTAHDSDSQWIPQNHRKGQTQIETSPSRNLGSASLPEV